MRIPNRPFESGTGRLFAVFVLSVVFLAIGLFSSRRAAGQRDDLTLKFGVENEFAGFEVLQSSSRLAINGAIAANCIMEPLFRIDTRGRTIPVLGLSAEPSADGKAWTVQLRKGVEFHDGTPFNADAVVAHWQRMLDPESKFRGRSALGVITSVEKAADHTVIFRLKHPWLPFRHVIANSRSLAGLIPSPAAVAQGIQNRAPVGTGPFRFKTWQSGDRFVVVKNTGYWQKDRPRMAAVVFTPMPDSQTRFAALRAGQLDMMWSDNGMMIGKAAASSDLTVYQSDDNGAEIFILNTATPPLDDIRVRRALAHAHHQAHHVNRVYNGSIPIVHHPLGPDCPCPNDGYRAHAPETAVKLLSGYPGPLTLECLHSNSPRGRKTGEITHLLMKNVGVTVTPVALNFGAVIKKVLSGQYQMSTWRMSSRPDQGPALFIMLHSQSRGNFSRYSNPEMDRLLIAQRTATDPARRQQLLCQIVRLINRDVPIIFRGGMRSHIIARKSVRGMPSVTHGIVQLENVYLVGGS